MSEQDHAAAPFRSIRVNSFSLPPAPGAPQPTSKSKGSESNSTFSSPAVNPGQLSLMVQHLGPLPTLSYGLPSGLALLGEHAPLLAVLAVPSNGRPLAGASLEFVIGRTTGALQPSDIVLVVDDTEGTKGLMALNNERYRVPLPTVAPGCRHTVRLWARSAAAGSAVVAAVLLCPAQVRRAGLQKTRICASVGMDSSRYRSPRGVQAAVACRGRVACKAGGFSLQVAPVAARFVAAAVDYVHQTRRV